MKLHGIPLGLGACTLLVASAASAGVSFNIGLGPIGISSYPPPPVVYQPAYAYDPPAVVYTGRGSWGGDRGRGGPARGRGGRHR